MRQRYRTIHTIDQLPREMHEYLMSLRGGHEGHESVVPTTRPIRHPGFIEPRPVGREGM